jgi:hypothetical protein
MGFNLMIVTVTVSIELAEVLSSDLVMTIMKNAEPV